MKEHTEGKSDNMVAETAQNNRYTDYKKRIVRTRDLRM